jgi:hypothetical protein
MNDICVLCAGDPDKEVIRLDIAINEGLVMD